MLTKATAQAIIDVVKVDPDSKKRIDSNIDNVLPDHWGLSGSMRNIGYVILNEDPTEKDIADRVCTGITEATSRAITKAIRAKDARLSKVKSAGEVARTHNLTYHVATYVAMQDTTVYVFDWHQTLSITNPMMFASTALWKTDTAGVTFELFTGFGTPGSMR